MKEVKEIKVFNGEIIKVFKIHYKWRNESIRFYLYDENGKFIRVMKKKEVEFYIDPNRDLKRKFAKERKKEND